MKQYYEWNSNRGEFIKSHKIYRKKDLKTIYRLAKNSDKDRILRFEIECIKTEPDVYVDIPDFRKLKNRLRLVNFDQAKDFAMAIALVKNKVVGLLSMSWFYNYDTADKIGVINDMWVLKSFRLAGIGGGLIELAKTKLKKIKVKKIELIVGLKNIPAKKLYEREGFKIREVGQAILEF